MKRHLVVNLAGHIVLHSLVATNPSNPISWQDLPNIAICDGSARRHGWLAIHNNKDMLVISVFF